ncbi:nuclear protein DGCR14 [Cyathus striatus]|nr:nuclear protein DGCR14 [Cyathus striatus]
MSTPSSSKDAPERSLNRQVVLDEDEYTAALSRIIARDFFPSLTHLDATNEYLDALQSRNPQLVAASVRRLEQINTTPTASSSRSLYQTPVQTPYGFDLSDTPFRRSDGEAIPKRVKCDIDMSLDQFQARYTSEDNSSFTHILDDENRTRKEKWGWAWEAQKRVEQQRSKMVESRDKMLIEPPPLTGVKERFVIEAPALAGFLTNGEESNIRAEAKEEDAVDDKKNNKQLLKTTIKDNSSGESDTKSQEVDVMAPKKDTRSAGVDGWNFKARNALMFSPDADESPYHPGTDVEIMIDPKVIKYGNTRLYEQELSSQASRGVSEPPSPTRSRIDAAITGTPYHPSSPRHRGFPLVPNVPSPTPAELGPTAMKQLMTWGTLNATPRVISQSDDLADAPSTPFHLPAISSRESLSHRLSSSASKSLRAKAELLGLGPTGRIPVLSRTPRSRKGDMAPPTWTPRRSEAAGNLTPAGKRLLERTSGTAAARRAAVMSRQASWEGSSKVKDRELNKVRWTPTPTSSSRG